MERTVDLTGDRTASLGLSDETKYYSDEIESFITGTILVVRFIQQDGLLRDDSLQAGFLCCSRSVYLENTGISCDFGF